MNALFVNDKSPYHAGSALVTREFHRLCQAEGISLRPRGNGMELAIVNGEGTPHHDRPGALELLDNMKRLSSKMPVALLNTVWDSMSSGLEGVSLVATRESFSAQALQNNAGEAVIRVLPDISLCCRHRPEGLARRKGWLFVDSVCRYSRSWVKKAASLWGGRYLEMCHWKDSAESLIDLMAEHEAVISGRFHGVVLALLADTPVLALPSNSHKTVGMMHDFGISDSYCTSPEALDKSLRERRFGRISRPLLDQIESDWRALFATLRDTSIQARAKKGHASKFRSTRQTRPIDDQLAPKVQPMNRCHEKACQTASPPPTEGMSVHQKEKTLLLNSFLWARDRDRAMQALNGGHRQGLLFRAWHSGGMLEVRDKVSPDDLGQVMLHHGVDLNQPIDLELRQPSIREEDGDLPSHEQTATQDTPEKGALEISLARPTLPSSPSCTAEKPSVSGASAPNQEVKILDQALISKVLIKPVFQTRIAPMFFRSDGGTVDLAELYHGQTLFLVLNGSSLKDFDWDKLRRPGICSMGINNGAHGFRPQFWTCVDDPTRFMPSIWQDPCIQKFVFQGHFDKPIWDTERDVLSNLKVRDFPNVLGYRRNERFQAKQWLHEDTFNWGNHQQYGGGRSVMLVALRLAYLLGFRKVHLLGCDFQMDEQNRYWFHEDRTPSSIRNNTNSYRILTGYFEQLKPHFEHAGFQVFNANPESQLKVFPFVNPDEALRSAEVRTSASTHGMYVDRFKASVLPKEECREFLEPLLAAVNAAEVVTDPFVHIQLSSVFPETTYRALLAHLPEHQHYQELRHADAIQPNGKSARLRFAFGDKEVAALPPQQRAFWQRVLQALRDPALEKAFREKLKADLHERFRDSLSEIILRPVPELIRDLTGYRIGAHTDIFKKVITTQFYLPEDDSQEPLGTSFYKRRSDGQFETTHRMPFLPATGYAFAVNSRSWHGVDTLPVLTKPRNSLMLTYYLGKAK